MPIRFSLKEADRNSINGQNLITSACFLSKVTHIYPRLLTPKVKTVLFLHPVPFRKFRLVLRMMKKMINPITERPLRPGTRFHAPRQMRLMPEQNIPVIRQQKLQTDTVKKLRLAAQKISHCAPSSQAEKSHSAANSGRCESSFDQQKSKFSSFQ